MLNKQGVGMDAPGPSLHDGDVDALPSQLVGQSLHRLGVSQVARVALALGPALRAALLLCLWQGGQP